MAEGIKKEIGESGKGLYIMIDLQYMNAVDTIISKLKKQSYYTLVNQKSLSTPLLLILVFRSNYSTLIQSNQY